MGVLLTVAMTHLIYGVSCARAIFVRQIKWREVTYELKSRNQIKRLDYAPFVQSETGPKVRFLFSRCPPSSAARAEVANLNILFLTLNMMEDIEERGIYKEFMREVASQENVNLYVVTPREKRTGLPTELTQYGNIHMLRVKTGNISKTHFFEKLISTFTTEVIYLRAIKQYFPNVEFDLVTYSTPPITFEKVVRHFKKTQNCLTYLMLKDIFPQNAVDLGVISKLNPLYFLFRMKEKKLYRGSDIIGCMSQANVEYVLKHNPSRNPNNVEVFPNAVVPLEHQRTISRETISKKYGFPEEATLFVYGGNLGKPQGIDFLLEVMDHFHQVENGYLLIVGSGTEYSKIENHIAQARPKNVQLLSVLPKDEFDTLLGTTDVGLIFLDHRFTIPNFPERLTAYMESSIPILAATDPNTDVRTVLQDSGSGFWSLSDDLDSFLELAKQLAANQKLRNEMGAKGRTFLEENFDIRKTIEIMMKHVR